MNDSEYDFYEEYFGKFFFTHVTKNALVFIKRLCFYFLQTLYYFRWLDF